jgi:hypothetical protein
MKAFYKKKSIMIANNTYLGVREHLIKSYIEIMVSYDQSNYTDRSKEMQWRQCYERMINIKLVTRVS